MNAQKATTIRLVNKQDKTNFTYVDYPNFYYNIFQLDFFFEELVSIISPPKFLLSPSVCVLSNN